MTVELVTGAAFASAFLQSAGAPKDVDRAALARWFDLALDEGRRTRPPAAGGWIEFVAAADECKRLAIRPEDVVAVAERPDATEILVDGHWLAVTDEYEAAVRLAAIR